jgi:hypothetical protein
MKMGVNRFLMMAEAKNYTALHAWLQ